MTHELFAAAAAQLKARRTREPGKQYTIDWPLKGRIVCAVCERPMSPHTIRYRNFLYRYYRCRSTAGGRKPCGLQVPAQNIEEAVCRELRALRRVSVEPGQIRDYVESIVYDPLDQSVRARFIPGPESEADTESGQEKHP